MKREELEGLTDEQKDLVMKLYGKDISKKDKELEDVKTKLTEANEKITTYETKINEFNETSKDNADWKAKYDELQTSIAEQEAKRKAEEDDKILTNNILSVFGEKKFTSDYAKNGLMNDIKTELSKTENKGKGIQEIFDSLTKDKTDIFVNPNQIKDMAGMGDSEEQNNVKEMPILW
jgi:chromosome segregation ATPase